MANCAICNASHATCRPPATVTPIDARTSRRLDTDMTLKTYQVVIPGRSGPGFTTHIRLSDADAAAQGLTDADLVDAAPAPAPAPKRRRAAATPKNKAAAAPKNKKADPPATDAEATPADTDVQPDDQADDAVDTDDQADDAVDTDETPADATTEALGADEAEAE